MNVTAQQAIDIAKSRKAKFPKLYGGVEIMHTQPQFQSQFDVVGVEAWIITGKFEMFGQIEHIWFVISDKTGKVEYIFDKHGHRWG